MIRCPYCDRWMGDVTDILSAEKKERELWNIPDSWTKSPDSITLDAGNYEIEYITTKEED